MKKIFKVVIIILFIFLIIFFIKNIRKKNNRVVLKPSITSVDLKLEQINFPNSGNLGIFDPSVKYDPVTNKVWMAYSNVINITKTGEKNELIESRMASSPDGGGTWMDEGVIIKSEIVTIPANIGPNETSSEIEAMWRNEVTALAYDKGAPESERWKVVWHKYLGIGGERLFQHGWIGYSSAPTPMGPWSIEQKLFTAKGYKPFMDEQFGDPLVKAHELHPDLKNCVGFSEPGMIATDDALYMSIQCGTVGLVKQRVIIMKLNHSNETWSYVGTAADDEDANAFGFDNFTGTEMFEQDGNHYLFVSPTEQPTVFKKIPPHRGCMLFEFEDIMKAKLVRDSDGRIVIKKYITAVEGEADGLCTYTPELTHSGIIYGKFFLDEIPVFRLFQTGIHPLNDI